MQRNGRVSRVVCRLRKSWKPGQLVQGTVYMTFGMAGRTLVQGVVFIAVARIMGAGNYGAYAAVLALAMAMGGFVGVGAPVLMMREVARAEQPFGRIWGGVLTVMLVSMPVILVLYLATTWWLLPEGVGLAVIVMVGFAEIVCAPFTLSAIQAYQGHDRIGRASTLVFVPVLPRLAAVGILIAFEYIDASVNLLEVWSFLYVCSSTLSMIYALTLVRKELGCAIFPGWHEVSHTLKCGLPFAFVNTALKLYADIDKALIARLVTLEAAGAYSAGYRVMDLAMIPMNAWLTATTARFFKAGQSGLGDALKYGWRIVPLPAVYAVVVGFALYASADMLPHVLGRSYGAAVDVLKWLAWLPLLALPRLFLQSSLVGADRQIMVVRVIAIGALANVILNLWLIPRWGWRGAVAATYFVEIAMTFGFAVYSYAVRYQVR